LHFFHIDCQIETYYLINTFNQALITQFTQLKTLYRLDIQTVTIHDF